MRLKLEEAKGLPALPDIDAKDSELVFKLISNEQYFKDQDLVQSILQFLFSSVALKGLDLKENQLLRFALTSGTLKKPPLGKLATPYAKILYRAFTEGEIKFEDKQAAIETWIFDKRAYDTSTYKLKTLITLSTPERLRRFVSDTSVGKRPFEKVLKAKSDKEIRDILNEYAPEDEETAADSKIKDNPEESKKRLFTYFRKLYPNKTDIPDDKLTELIEKGLKGTSKLKELKVIIQDGVAKILKLDSPV